MTLLKNNVNPDFSNVPSAGRLAAIEWLSPDYSAMQAISPGYVCDDYCYIVAYGTHINIDSHLLVNSLAVGIINFQIWGAGNYAKSSAYAFCKPGDVVTFIAGLPVFKCPFRGRE